MERIKITQGQMNLMLAAVEHGFREHERGKNLQAAIASIFDMYEVTKTNEAARV